MTNDEVKSMWEASGRKARVEFLSRDFGWIADTRSVPSFAVYIHRIHPDDIHLCTKPPTKLDYAKRMIEAIEASKELEYKSMGGAWIADGSNALTAPLNALNNPDLYRIKPKTLKVWLYEKEDGSIFATSMEEMTKGHDRIVRKTIDVELP
jgi:hypothetical protein